MSRSGYTEECDGWTLIRWRGAVASGLRGKRGQAFLKDLIVALDALPEQKLIEGELEAGGEVCALGAVGRQRGIDMQGLTPYTGVAELFGISDAMAREIMWVNDDAYAFDHSPENRFQRVRLWAVNHLEQPVNE